jgi:hypothetical protein
MMEPATVNNDNGNGNESGPAGPDVMPTTRDGLWQWVKDRLGIQIAREQVCACHTPPLELLAEQVLDNPSVTLWHGPRGAGKSFLSAIHTHIASRFNDRYGTRILGGSKAQSEQIYGALRDVVIDGNGKCGNEAETIDKLLKGEALYANGSKVAILAASPTSVRGPHVPSLKLDEVDEINSDIRESAMGMVMEIRGQRANVLMTSTWHRVGGPMSELIELGLSGSFPIRTFCIFEVLERCPDERSGTNLEKCPECPIVRWCHADRHTDPEERPKAKRSDGHYTIDSLIQKAKVLSARVFESDYLCLGPKADGAWFSEFEESKNVSAEAEYNPRLPVHLSVDSGVFTSAVFFQVYRINGENRVNVFADFLKENLGAEVSARLIVERARELCPNARLLVSTDSAGGYRNPIGPTVLLEYQKAGLIGLDPRTWLRHAGCVSDGLKLIESFVRTADQTVRLRLHPRCGPLINAFKSYRRAKRSNQWMDYPEDPQHPHEDMIDALRGGLRLAISEQGDASDRFRQVPAGSVF